MKILITLELGKLKRYYRNCIVPQGLMSLIKDSKDVFSKLPCLNPPTPSRGKQAVGGAPSLDTGRISHQFAMAW